MPVTAEEEAPMVMGYKDEYNNPEVEDSKGRKPQLKELPKHLRDYKTPNAPAAAQTPLQRRLEAIKAMPAYEQEDIRASGEDHHGLFKYLDSETFQKARRSVVNYGQEAGHEAEQMMTATGLTGPTADARLRKMIADAQATKATEIADQFVEYISLLPGYAEGSNIEDIKAAHRTAIHDLLLGRRSYDDKPDHELTPRELSDKAFEEIHHHGETPTARINRRIKESLKGWRNYETWQFASEIDLLHEQALRDDRRNYHKYEQLRVNAGKVEQLSEREEGLYDRLVVWKRAIEAETGPDGKPIRQFSKLLPRFERLARPDFESPDFGDMIIAGADIEKHPEVVLRRITTAKEVLGGVFLPPLIDVVRTEFQNHGFHGDALDRVVKQAETDLLSWLIRGSSLFDWLGTINEPMAKRETEMAENFRKGFSEYENAANAANFIWDNNSHVIGHLVLARKLRASGWNPLRRARALWSNVPVATGDTLHDIYSWRNRAHGARQGYSRRPLFREYNRDLENHQLRTKERRLEDAQRQVLNNQRLSAAELTAYDHDHTYPGSHLRRPLGR